MITMPVLRWGKPYESLEFQEVIHFNTGEAVAKVGQANGGMVARDMRKADKARDALKQFSIEQLIGMAKKAGELFATAELPMGDGTQTADQFAEIQSASTGLPVHMCKANMTKNQFVLDHMDEILAALTRGLDLNVLSKGWGVENGIPISYQVQTPVLSLVLPSNSPGVHTLWMPILPLQIGLVLKPGAQEPWTCYRMAEAFFQAGFPRESIGLYPGPRDVAATIMSSSQRSMIFGSQQTVDQYKGDPRVQVHGPGYSKIIFGDDMVDDWEKHLDLMFDSVYANGGRSCINCSSIWASRHTEEIADALAKRLAKIEVLPPEDPNAGLAAFTTPGVAEAVNNMIENDLSPPGVSDITAKYRDGSRLVQKERCDYLLPTVVHSDSHEPAVAKAEYMFPFVSVVKCPEDQMLKNMGYTLVCTAITENEKLQDQLIDATFIDRLNVGAIPTIKLNWLQPHEGNIVEFLFRARAFQHTG